MTYFIICGIQIKPTYLHRYPENNLFTLRKLIPIENLKMELCEKFHFLLYSGLRVIFGIIKEREKRSILSVLWIFFLLKKGQAGREKNQFIGKRNKWIYISI